MKKRTLMLSLVIALAMVMGSFTTVFAGTGLPTENTKEAVKGVQSVGTFSNEIGAEKFAMNLYKETKEGKYKLLSTGGVKKVVGKKNVVIVDTMPSGWWKQRHIPGAIVATAGGPDMSKAPDFVMTAAEKKDLLKKVNKACKQKQYYNEKTKKWQNKKPAAKNWKKKKTRKVNKDKQIVIYCGFTKCKRSHQAAKYLVSQGFTKVYRYPGGIAAWVAGNNKIEGTDIK